MTTPFIFGNKIYIGVEGDWYGSRVFAKSLGGDLVIIEDDIENKFVHDLVSSYYSGTDGAWIGFLYNHSSEQYEWVDGSPLSFSRWAPGEPNRTGDFGHIWATHIYTPADAGYWDDIGSNVGHGIAEIPFIRSGDSAYVIVQGPTWEEAEANAVKLGGHLVTINDAAENEWIVANYSKEYLTTPWWIGLSDKDLSGTWEWADGSNQAYFNWAIGEPNTNGDYGPNYVQIYINSNVSSTLGKWNDQANWNGWNPDGFPTLGIAEIKLAPNYNPIGAPSLSGTFKTGQAISLDRTYIYDADNVNGWTPTYNYSWEVSTDNGSTWTKLTTTDATDNNSTYILTTAEVGKKVRGVVSYLDGYGTYEVVDSDASVSVVNGDIGSTTTTASKTTTLASTVSRLTLTGTRNINGTGNALNNYLTGTAGNNILDGGAGYDILAGGRGNDTYIVDSTYDSIIENANEGTDTVKSFVNWTLGANLENLTLTGTGNLSGTGNELDNVITGNSGNNSLYGGGGNDKLYGMAGDDNLWVNIQADSINSNYLLDGGADNDSLWINVQGANNAVTSSLAGGSGVDSLWVNIQENNNYGTFFLDGGTDSDSLWVNIQGNNSGGTFTLNGGTGNDSLWVNIQGDNSGGTFTLNGGTGNDSLWVNIQGNNNGGNFLLNGSSGDDSLNVTFQGDNNSGKTTLKGGAGNDTYYVNSTGYSINDTSGTDSVVSSASWTLGSNLENLTLTGTGALTGIGNTLKNTIIGNAGNNVLDGMGGTDILTGGAGADIFRFSTKPKFGASSADHITDFNTAEGDRIQISKSAFGMASNATASLTTVSSASALTTALGSTSTFVYDSSNGNLYWNQNGNKSGFGSGGIFAVLDNKSTLSGSSISLGPDSPIISSVGGSDATVSSQPNDNLVVGTAEAAATVTIYGGGVALGTTTADSNGAFSYALTKLNLTALGQGTGKSISAKATDAAGNASNASAAKMFAVSTVDPITGLNVNFNGVGNVAFGTVYSGNGIGDNLIGAIDVGYPRYGSKIQFQGGEDYIVITQDSTEIDRTVTRSVLGGDFSYDNGLLSSARVREFYSIQMKNDGITDNDDEGFSAELPGEGTIIGSISDLSAWAAIGDLEFGSYETGNYHGDEAGWSNFTNYSNGRFYAIGWDQSPFALISGL